MNNKVSRRMLFIYICLLLAVLGMEAGGLQYHLLLISREMHLGAARMGNLVSAQYVAFILIPLLFGSLGDRYGKKKILIVSDCVFPVAVWHWCWPTVLAGLEWACF